MRFEGVVHVIQEGRDVFTVRFAPHSSGGDFHGPQHLSISDTGELLMKMQIPATKYNKAIHDARKKGSGRVGGVSLTAEELGDLKFERRHPPI